MLLLVLLCVKIYLALFVLFYSTSASDVITPTFSVKLFILLYNIIKYCAQLLRRRRYKNVLFPNAGHADVIFHTAIS
jgi:hypothetical protein